VRNNPKLMVFRDDDIVNHLHNLARHTRIYKLGGPGFSATRAFYFISFSPLDGPTTWGGMETRQFVSNGMLLINSVVIISGYLQ
jgi:hypothetical protein